MVTLESAYKFSTKSVGNKAYNLSIALNAGFRVSHGIVITSEEIEGATDYFQELPIDENSLYALRSSAYGEDSDATSWAGQFLTLINVSSGDVEVGVKKIVEHGRLKLSERSYYSDKLLPGLAVLIQRMVKPQYSGVIFTRNPVNQAEECLVELVIGYGENLVSGFKTPNRYTIKEQQLINQEEFNFLVPSNLLFELTGIANQLKGIFQKDLDIEFVVEHNTSHVYIMQARPITSTKSLSPRANAQYSANFNLLHGVPASGGQRVGKVVLAESPNDEEAMKLLDDNSILVTKFTEPSYLPMFLKIRHNGAVVTEVGGMLSHAAIVARELRLPAVVNVKNATRILKTGELIKVDGDNGLVTILGQG